MEWAGVTVPRGRADRAQRAHLCQEDMPSTCPGGKFHAVISPCEPWMSHGTYLTAPPPSCAGSNQFPCTETGQASASLGASEQLLHGLPIQPKG